MTESLNGKSSGLLRQPEFEWPRSREERPRQVKWNNSAAFLLEPFANVWAVQAEKSENLKGSC